jgi:hypothetical protein
MGSAYDLTTKQGLFGFLVDTESGPRTVQLLPGSSDYVYRVTYDDGDTSIFKHAAPYLRCNVDIDIAAARLDFEAAILNTIPTIESQELATHAVEALH